MTINFNVEPYHDDFDENKKFVRILFRPGYAVQARELTQLQTIIQKQLERTGNHLFKDGAMVIPGQISFDKEYNYVKLVATNNTIQTDSIIDTFIGKDVIGATTGISARVVNVTRGSANGGVPLLHVKYNSSGDDNVTQVFAENETLTIIAEEQQNQLEVKTVSSAATGVGSAVSIQAGVYYVKGYFIYVEEQTIVLQYNSTTPSYRVGLQITESIVTPEEDETLLDNAQNSYNYTAPGAHRYAIYLTLIKKGISTTDDTDFIELLRVDAGRIQRIVDRTEYAELEKTLARRTYDESGNYTVTPFASQVREYRSNNRAAWTRNRIYLYGDVVSYYDSVTKKTTYYTCREEGTSTANTNVTSPANDDLSWELTPAPVYNRGVYIPNDEMTLNDHKIWESKIAVGVEPGKAYVYGYEIQKQSIEYVPVDKARETDSRNDLLIPADMGNFVVVRNLNGAPNISQLEQVKIFNAPRSINMSGTIIDASRIKSVAVTDGGSGYTSAPNVVFSAPEATWGDVAQGTATISGAGITGFTSIVGGSGYTSFPTVTITAAPGDTGTGATANAILSGAAVTGYVLTQAGTGYVEVPLVSISAPNLGGGSQATATATISGGVVTALTISGGSGYSTAPTITINAPRITVATSAVNITANTITYNGHGITSGNAVRYKSSGGTVLAGLADNGTYYANVVDLNTIKLYTTAAYAITGGATGLVDLTGTGNNTQYFELASKLQATATSAIGTSTVTGFAITNAGSGYRVAPSLSVTGGGASVNATANVTIGTSAVTGIIITNAGSGYATEPSISFNGGSGADAEAEATLFGLGTTIELASGHSTVGLVEGMELSKISGIGTFGAGAKIDTIEDDRHITMTTGALSSGAITFNAVVGGTEVGTARVRGFELHTQGSTQEENEYKMFLFDINMYYYNVELKKKYSFINSAKHFTTNSVNPGISTFSANTVLDTEQKSGSVKTNGVFIYGTLTKFTTEFAVGDWIYVNDKLRRIAKIENDFNMSVHWNIGDSGSDNYLPIYFAVRPLYGSVATSLIFPLPNYATTNINKAVYSVTKYFTDETVTIGTVTLVASVGEQFVSGATAGKYVLFNQTTGKTITYTGTPTLGSGNSTITFSGINATDGTLVNVIATVYKSLDIDVIGSISKTKEATDTTYTVTTQVAATKPQIFLGKSDGIVLKSVIMKDGTFASPGSKTTDITSRYTFNGGQTESYYGPCSISLKTGQPVPTGQLVITFQYFEHANLSHDFFSANSYPDYKSIPSYKQFNLRDCLDFRQRVGDGSYDGSLIVPAHSEVLPKFGEEFSISYDYYLSRKTNIFLNKNGSFSTNDSASELNPKEPEPKTEAMLIYRMQLEPYTFNTTSASVVVQTEDNKRYTMRDIGRLEKRINSLEYYTSLSLLEQQTKSMTILDSDGFDRFKSGFVVDNFTGHIVGDANNPDYICSMDFDNGYLRPFYTMESVDFTEVLQNQTSRKAKNYQLTGDLITLPYTNTALVTQPYASRTENINPFAIFTFIGNMDMTPAVDNWFEVTRRPDIVVPVEGNYSTIKALAEKAGVLGTVWNAWQTQWTGKPVTQTFGFSNAGGVQTVNMAGVGSVNVNIGSGSGGGVLRYVTAEVTATEVGQSRTGIKTTLQEKIEYKTVDDKVLSVAVIPYIRSRQVLIQAKGLKPKTKFYPFFDKVGVNDYCTPASKITVNTIKNSSGITTTIDSFDTDANVGSDYKDPARSMGPNPDFSLNVGDVIFVSKRGNSTYTFMNSPVTAVVVGKDYSVSSGVSTLHIVNIKDSITTDGFGFNTTDTISGSISGTTAVITGITLASKGGDLVTNLNGDVNFLYEIPNTESLRFRCGNRELALFDTATYPAVVTGTRAIKTYHAEGRKEERQATVHAIRNAELVQETVSDTRTITDTSSRIVSDTGWYDPLAQTFLVDCEGGCFLTKVDLYFATKDLEKPAIVQLREVVNGYPGRTILPFSEVTLKPEQVVADPNASLKTEVVFKSPIFVEHNKEYAICLISNSNNYNVWISQLGEKNKGTDQFISQQPYAGVLFKSQNASTWTADQNQDLKFTIHRAKFSTNVIAEIDFENKQLPDDELPEDPFQFTADSNMVRVHQPNHGLVASTLANGERSSIAQFRKIGDTMTGTIKPSSSSTTLLGVGTQFNEETEVGAAIYRDDNVYVGTVASIESDTSLTLTANPTMTNSTGISFKVIKTINGVRPVDILDKKFKVVSAELDSYVIALDPSINPTDTTVAGGVKIFAARDVQYDMVQPMVAVQNFPKTQTNYSFRGTKSKSVDGTQVPYDYVTSLVPVTINENNLMPVPMSIAADVNTIYEVNSSGTIATRSTPINLSAQSTTVRNTSVFRINFVSEVDSVSPVFDTRNMSVITISNRINNPASSMNITELDDRLVVTGLQEGTDVVLTSGTVSNLDFAAAGTDDKNFIKTIRSGQYITISGSKATANNKSWLVTDVDPNGEYLYVSGAIVVNGTNAAGDNFTITSKDRYFSEITPVGSSTYSKYVTKKINFTTPATTLKIALAAYVPPKANVDVYYKISKVEDYEDFEYVEWVLASNTTTFTKSDVMDQFVETEIDVNNLPQFNAMSLKIVFRSTDSTQVPVVRDLRIIACA